MARPYVFAMHVFAMKHLFKAPFPFLLKTPFKSWLIGAFLYTFANLAFAGPIYYFNANMDGGQETPPNGSTASGYAQFWIDAETMTIDWLLTVSGISLDQITGLHIHAAPAGVAGPVVINFSGQLSGSDLFDADTLAVLANPTNFYVNLHTVTFPGGEIRGQLQVPTPQSLWLLAVGGLVLVLSRMRR